LLITIVDGGQDLLFDSSSSELKPRLISLLEKLAPIIGQLDNQIQVHGHTDARPFPKGSGRSNWQLSFERANNAREVLEDSGLRKGQVSGVFAHGDSSLMNKKEPFAPENRRLAILAVRKGVEPSAKPAQSGKAAPRASETPAKPAPAPSDTPKPDASE
jgi:chemotaxis protein MotB